MSNLVGVNVFALPPLLAAAVLLGAAILVLLSERFSRTSVLYAVLTGTLSVWLFTFGVAYLSEDPRHAVTWFRMGYLAIPFLAAAVYHFTLVLLGRYHNERFYVWLSWAVSLLFAEQFYRSKLFVAGVERYWWGFYPRFDVGGAVFLGYFAVPLLAGMWHFWTDYRLQEGKKQRERIRAFMLALAIGYIALIDFLPAFGIGVYPFGYIPALGFAAVSLAAIRRYRLVTITPASAAHQILDTMRGAVIVTDRTDTITVANRAACEMLGYEPRELIGSPITAVTNTGAEQNGSTTWRRRDGSLVEVSVSASTLAERRDLPAGMIYTALDISQLKNAQSEVKRSVSMLRATIEATTDGILVIDRSGAIASFNRRFAEMWRIPQQILDTRDDARAVAFVLDQLKEPDQFVAKVTDLYAHPEAESFDALEFRDGRVFERYSAPQMADGVPVGRVWSFRDVTERKRAEEALRRRDMVMEAVGFAAEQFLRTTNWKNTITAVMKNLGGATEVTHVYIYQAETGLRGEQVYRHKYEWVAPGFSPAGDDAPHQRIAVERGFKSWAERLRRGEVIQGHTRDLRPVQLEALQETDIRSGIVVPIRVENRLWGAIGFTDAIREREWLPVEIDALRVAAVILAAAIQRRESEEALYASETRYRMLFERNLAGVFRVSLDGRFLECNDACANIFGYDNREEMLGRRAVELYYDPAERQRFIRHLLERRVLTNIELRLRRRDGSPVWVLENVSLHSDEHGEPVLEGTLVDISDRKRAEQQVEYQAYHDVLTGLPNRMLFQDRLTVALAHAQRLQLYGSVAVMFLDLDHFKLINDTLGHNVGDLLLKGVAGRLTAAVREEDTVARLGGDEFTLLLSHLATEADAAKIAQKLLETIEKPFRIEGHELHVTTSIGVAMYPADGTDAETLLKNADSAMYRAKELGRNAVQLCTPAMNRRALERLSIESSLRRAVDRGEFVLHYQPQVRIDAWQVVGVEALVRWNHPERGLVGPTEFIGIAEEARLILPLGEWVLREAAKQTRQWQEELGRSSMRVAVNISARQFQQRNLLRMIERALADTGLRAECLELEITEGVAMQNTEYTIALMRDLKSMGLMIAMDDFGTGHSSLNYLKRFPIDTIKVDQAFIRDLRLDSDAAIVTAMITMAQGMRLRVIAEGVETEEQIEFLRDKGCEIFQGFLFSAPVAAGEIPPMLRGEAADERMTRRRPRRIST